MHSSYLYATTPIEGNMFATGSYDKKIKIWKEVSSKNWKEVCSLEETIPIQSLLQLKDGRLLVGGTNGDVHIWSPANYVNNNLLTVKPVQQNSNQKEVITKYAKLLNLIKNNKFLVGYIFATMGLVYKYKNSIATILKTIRNTKIVDCLGGLLILYGVYKVKY